MASSHRLAEHRSAGIECGVASAPSPGLTRAQRKNLIYASLGTMLEFFEFTLFGFFAVIIGQLFFPPELPIWMRELQTFAIFAIGYLIRPLSGAVIGHLGDKFGRKRLFVFTVLMMALPTTLMGVLPTYAQIGLLAPLTLLLLRVCQGLAVAGEVAGAAVFITEHVPSRKLGWAAGWFYSAAFFAQFAGAALAALMSNVLDPETLRTIGWRIPFILGGVFGLVAVYLRRSLDETPLFEEIRRTKSQARTFPFLEVLRNFPLATLYVVGLAAYQSVIVVAVYFYMPALLQNQLGMARPAVFNASAAGLFALAAAMPAWGWIADRAGLGRILLAGAIGNVAVVILFFANLDAIAAAPYTLLWWYIAFSVACGTIVAVPALATLVFPTEVRFTGFALGYNVGAAIFAGTTPLVVSWLASFAGRTAAGVYIAVACFVGVALGLLAPRLKLFTRG